jgi:hypothetical protein
MKPEYIRAKLHLDNPNSPEYAPRNEVERKAVKTIQGQRRYNTNRIERIRENRLKLQRED